MVEPQRRHVCRARHRVITQRAGQQLTIGVVRDAFGERLADSLGDPAVHLALDDQRIDDVATIVDGHDLVEADPAGFAIDAHHGQVRPERPLLRRIEQFVGLEAGLFAGRRLGRIRHPGDVLPRHPPRWRARHREATLDRLDVGQRYL